MVGVSGVNGQEQRPKHIDLNETCAYFSFFFPVDSDTYTGRVRVVVCDVSPPETSLLYVINGPYYTNCVVYFS